MRRILVIGGTGLTGRELIKQALNEGYMVNAIVRDPSRLKISHSNLKVFQADVLHRESFGEAFAGCEAVISALGHKRFFIKTSILSQGTLNIIAEMRARNINRFICITALGIGDSRFKLGLYYTLFVEPFILYFYFRDKEKQERIIRKSGLNWTIVRPGQLLNGKGRKAYKTGKNLGHYILTKMIARADVAHFILRILRNNECSQEVVAITI